MTYSTFVEFFYILQYNDTGDFMEEKDVEERIIAVIDKIRPFLISDGGNIEYVKFKDGIVYVKFIGQCSNCQLIDVTLKDGIEMALVNEIPEVIEVRNIDSMSD